MTSPSPSAAVLALIAAAKATTEIDGCGFAVKVNERTGANLVEVPFVAYVQLHEALAALPDLAEYVVVPRKLVVQEIEEMIEHAAFERGQGRDLMAANLKRRAAKLRECLT